MASKFSYNAAASKKAHAKEQEKSGSKFGKRFKMKGEKAVLLLLPPIGDDGVIFGTNITHTHFSGDGKFLCKSASPKAFEKKDKLEEIGWRLKAKYDPKEGKGKPHSNKKIKDLWKSFMSGKETVFNVLDLNDLEAGPQEWSAPKPARELIFSEIDDCDGDLTSICDFNQGRKLLVQKKGKGLQTEYVVKFSTKTADLNLEAEAEDKIATDMRPLGTSEKSLIQDKFNDADYEKVYAYLAGKAKKLDINIEDFEGDDEKDENEVDDESEELVGSSEDDEEASDDADIDEDADDDIADLDEEEISDDAEIEEEIEEDFNEEPKKPVGKPVGKKK